MFWRILWVHMAVEDKTIRFEDVLETTRLVIAELGQLSVQLESLRDQAPLGEADQIALDALRYSIAERAGGLLPRADERPDIYPPVVDWFKGDRASLPTAIEPDITGPNSEVGDKPWSPAQLPLKGERPADEPAVTAPPETNTTESIPAEPAIKADTIVDKPVEVVAEPAENRTEKLRQLVHGRSPAPTAAESRPRRSTHNQHRRIFSESELQMLDFMLERFGREMAPAEVKVLLNGTDIKQKHNIFNNFIHKLKVNPQPGLVLRDNGRKATARRYWFEAAATVEPELVNIDLPPQPAAAPADSNGSKDMAITPAPEQPEADGQPEPVESGRVRLDDNGCLRIGAKRSLQFRHAQRQVITALAQLGGDVTYVQLHEALKISGLNIEHNDFRHILERIGQRFTDNDCLGVWQNEIIKSADGETQRRIRLLGFKAETPAEGQDFLAEASRP